MSTRGAARGRVRPSALEVFSAVVVAGVIATVTVATTAAADTVSTAERHERVLAAAELRQTANALDTARTRASDLDADLVSILAALPEDARAELSPWEPALFIALSRSTRSDLALDEMESVTASLDSSAYGAGAALDSWVRSMAPANDAAIAAAPLADPSTILSAKAQGISLAASVGSRTGMAAALLSLRGAQSAMAGSQRAAEEAAAAEAAAAAAVEAARLQRAQFNANLARNHEKFPLDLGPMLPNVTHPPGWPN